MRRTEILHRNRIACRLQPACVFLTDMSIPDVSSVPDSSIDTEKQAFWEGFKISTGALPGICAWGVVSGMAMVKSGLTLTQALGMTFIVFGGTMQLASLPLIVANAPIWLIFVTSMVVNLRFVIFAAAIGPHFAHLPWYKRIWYGYLNGDTGTAFFAQRFPLSTLHQPQGKIGFFAGVCYPNWWVWQIGSVAGILLASQIPQSWGIGFAGTLVLLAIMVPLIINAAALAGVAVTGVVAVVAAGLPYRLGLLLAVLVGMAVAMMADSLLDKRKKRERNA
jgi:predicted branched-subunit amino acid permease